MNDACTSSVGAADTTRQAVVFNNQGTALLQSGRYEEAVTAFTAVLEILKPFIPGAARPVASFGLHGPMSPSATSNNANSGGSSCPPCPSNADKVCCVQGQDPYQHHASMKVAPSSSSWGPYFVFQDPIDIPLDVIPRQSSPSQKLITKFVVVVTYNLALAVHLCSLLYQNQPEQLRVGLSRAQKLYELAFQMHLQESCDVTLLYSLALMNNLGLIYRMLGDEERSQRCFGNQLTTMMYLLEAQEAQTIKQWDGLFSNVMELVLKKDREITAPAA